MNIYKISQTACRGYDTYDSAIVVAETAQSATLIYPSCNKEKNWYEDYENNSYFAWSHPKDVQVKLIGIASREFTEECVLLASYNAG